MSKDSAAPPPDRSTTFGTPCNELAALSRRQGHHVPSTTRAEGGRGSPPGRGSTTTTSATASPRAGEHPRSAGRGRARTDTPNDALGRLAVSTERHVCERGADRV